MRPLLLLACVLALPGRILAAQTLAIDAGKTGEPISPYLYGQFIEHVGRGVYGGLWAEMLEDRKFFFPVADAHAPWQTRQDAEWASGPYSVLAASPWKVVGPAGSVTMSSSSYAGRSVPVVKLAGGGAPAGLSQDGLALIKGKEYSGSVLLSGDASAFPIEIQLRLDDGRILTRKLGRPGDGFQRRAFRFTAPADCGNAALAVLSRGRGTFSIGAASLMPADNLKGWRRDVVALLRRLGATIYRWPGGNFVSGYDWRDGIGPRDERPPRKNPAWSGVEPNDVGADEYMELLGLLGAEAYVAINTGLGDALQAAQEVEYFNGSVETPMGGLRARNGHAAPYGVRWWAVGNEMSGDWQLGHMPVERYALKHNEVVAAMRAVDPSVKTVAVGEPGPWDEAMLKSCAGSMTLLSQHIYVKQRADVAAHADFLAEVIRGVARIEREYRRSVPELAGKDIRVALDEWNYWHGPYLYGELGVRFRLKDALGVAQGLHEYFRNSDLYFMANYAQAVNALGAVKTSRTAAAFDATALPLMLYRRRFGSIPIPLAAQPAGMDVSAAWTKDRKAVTVAIVNPRPRSERLTIDWGKLRFRKAARRWVVSSRGGDPESFNEPGKPSQVTLTEDGVSSDAPLAVAPYSIALYRLTLD